MVDVDEGDSVLGVHLPFQEVVLRPLYIILAVRERGVVKNVLAKITKREHEAVMINGSYQSELSKYLPHLLITFTARSFLYITFFSFFDSTVYIFFAKERKPGQDRQNGTSRTGQAERDRQNRTARASLPAQDCQDRTARKGLPGRDCQDRIASTRLPGQGR